MIDMYGSEVTVGYTVITKVNPKTVEFTYDYVPTAKYYSPSTNVAKRKSNQIILLHPF